MSKREPVLQYDQFMTNEERAAQQAYLEEQQANSWRGKLWSFFESIQYSLTNNRDVQNYLKMVMLGLLITLVLVVGVIGLKSISDYYNAKGEWVGQVSQLRYQRNRYIQQYDGLAKEGWYDEVPSLAYDNQYIGRRVHHYDTEYYWSTCTETKTEYYTEYYTDSDGDLASRQKSRKVEYTESCRKSKQVPVYRDWHGWTLNAWHDINTITNAETQAVIERKLEAKWPQPDGLVREYGTEKCGVLYPLTVTGAQHRDPLLGCQRMSSVQTESYWFTYAYEAKDTPYTFECGTDYPTFQTLRTGMPAYGIYYEHNMGFDCRDGRLGVKPTATPAPK